MRPGPAEEPVLFARARRIVTAATILAVLTLFIAASPTIETPARAADPAPVYNDEDLAERLWQLQLQRASRDRGISGLGPVEAVPDRSQPRQPKKTEAQPTAPAKKPPAKKPATKAPAQPPVKAAGNLSAVVAFALRQQGKPYIWGASGPSAYDCSGLVMASYMQIGIRLPHQSEQIRARGTVVPQSQWFPGMVLYKPGHVGLYLGGGKMIHASKPGTPVAVVSIYGSFTGLRVG